MTHRNKNPKRSLTLGLFFGLISFFLLFALLYRDETKEALPDDSNVEVSEIKGKLDDDAYTIRKTGRLNWKRGSARAEPPRPASNEKGAIASYLEKRIEALQQELREAETNEKIQDEYYNQQIHHLQDRLNRETEALQEKSALIQDLKNQILAAHDTHAMLEQNLRDLSGKLEEEQKRARESEKSSKRLQGQVEKLTIEVHQAKNLLQSAEESGAVATKMLKQKDEAILALKDQIEHLNHESARKENLLAEQTKAREYKMTQLEERLQEAKKHQTQYVRQLKESREIIERIDGELQAKSIELAGRQAQVEDLQSQLLAVNQQRSETENQIEILNRQLAAEKHRSQDHDAIQSSLREKIQDLSSQLESTRQIAQMSQDREAGMQSRLHQIRQEMAELENRRENDAQALAEKESEVQSRDLQLKALRQETALLNQELDHERNKLLETDSMRDELAAAVRELTREVEDKTQLAEKNEAAYLHLIAQKDRDLLNLDNHLNQLNAEISQKQGSIATLQDRLDQRENDVQGLERQMNQIAARLAEKDQIIHTHEQAQLQLKSEIQGLAEQALRDRELAKQAEAKDQLKTGQLREKENELIGLAARHEQTISELKSQIAAARDQIDQKTRLVENLQSELIAGRQHQSSLQEQVRELEAEKVELANRCDQNAGELKSQIAAAREQIDQKTRLVENLQSELIAGRQHQSSLEEQIDELKSAEVELSRVVDAARERDEKNEELLKEKDRIAAQLNQRMHELSEAYENKIARMKERMNEVKNAYVARIQELEDKEQEIVAAEDKLSEDLRILSEKNALIEDFKNQLIDRQREMAQLKQDLDAERNAFQQLEKNQQDLEGLVKDFKEKEADQKQQIATLQDELSQYENEKLTQSRQLEEKEHLIAAAKEEAEALRKEMVWERQKLMTLIQKIKREYAVQAQE